MKTVKVLGFTAVAFVSIALAVAVYSHWTHGPLEFDRSAWLRGERDPESLRPRMADGLITSNALAGKSKAEVETMLGPPTATDHFQEFGLAYCLGPERGYISIDSEWLVMNFDGQGKVREARIVTD